MPRTLPWLVKQQPATKSSSSPATKHKRASSPSSDLGDCDLNTTGVATPQRRKKQRDANRSPSTSPPPAPPDVEYMHQGLTGDDIWMMVEDEFFSTAQSFTQHIHHAEYVRLKKLAKSRGDSTLQGLQRGTDGRTEQSAATRLKIEAEERARRAKGVVNGMMDVSEGEDEEEDFMADPQLAGLMTASQRDSRDLRGVVKAKSNTRAAAGFAKSPKKERSKPGVFGSSSRPAAVEAGERDEEGSDDSDDLDASSFTRSKSKQAHTHSKHQRPKPETSSSKSTTNGFFKRFTKSSPEHHRNASSRDPQSSRLPSTSSSHDRSASKKGAEPDETDGYTQSARSQATADFLAKRRAAKAAKEKQQQRDAARYNQPTSKDGGGSGRKSVVDVPTFMI